MPIPPHTPRGCCSQAGLCTYLHRLPLAEDEEYHRRDMGSDIFGREKRGEDEGYRKGAGGTGHSGCRGRAGRMKGRAGGRGRRGGQEAGSGRGGRGEDEGAGGGGP